MLAVAIGAMMALGVGAGDWQDGLLNVPYGGHGRTTALGLRVERQDFEKLARNRSVIGTPLTLGGRRFERGLGTHSVSRITVQAPEPIVRFSAQVGVDDNERTNGPTPVGSVTFTVSARGQELFATGVLRPGQAPVPVDMELGGVGALELSVGDGGDGPMCDHADWAEAAITLKSGRKVFLDELPELPSRGQGRYPFSFVYGGRASDELLPGWRTERRSERLDKDRERVTTTWTDPDTGLKVTWQAVRYADFPAIEWLLYLENTGSADTAVVEDLQALDATIGSPISAETPYRLHRTAGSRANRRDFEPSVVTIGPRQEEVLSGGEGKSSLDWLPFFKVDQAGGALVLAVGWSGQWKASFASPDAKGLQLRAGLELTHFKLHPGERVRTPRVLMLNHSGESLDANAAFRELVLKHYAAKRSGKTPLPTPFCNTCFTRGGVWLNECNAENQISLIKAYAKLGLEALLTDAGWFEGGWPEGAGNWNPRKDAYPQGMGPVAKAAKDNGMIYGLWFEPERVVAGTAFAREHPEWTLSTGVPGERTLAANFGLKEVQDHFFGIVKGFMDLPGFRVYRQDFNFMPLNWWRANDAPDRQGMTEMKYIEGLYAYWDRIAQAWPDSLREECASGGMRIDLETVMRMHLHQKTDYWFDDEADQGHLFGLSQYLPNGVVVGNLGRLDDYSFRSSLASSLCLGWIADAPDFDSGRGKALLARYRELRPLLSGGWTPLLPYTLNATEWMASQYDRPDLGQGMVLAFRHSASPYPTAEVALRRLDPAATYELSFESSGAKRRATGAELMRGLTLSIPARRGSELMVYRKVKR